MRDDPVFGMAETPNQSPPFVDRNLFLEDRALQDAVAAAGVDAGAEALADFGAASGSAEAMELGRLANEFPPRLRLVDARGNRLDQVEFHPAYHALMARNMAVGPALLDLGSRPAAGDGAVRTGGARGASVHRDPGRKRPYLSADDDQRERRGAAPRAGGRGEMAAEDSGPRL